MNTLTTAMAAFGIALVLVTQTLDLGPTSHEAVPPLVATINVSGDHVGADIRSEDLTDLVQQYCQVCHNDVMMTGNLSLTGFDVAAAPAMAETAERMRLIV